MHPRRRIAAALAALAFVACGSDTSGEAAPSTTATTAAPTTTTPAPTAGRPFVVEGIELVVEDPTRPTAAAPERGLAERPTRTLPLLVLAPEGDGPFPVVVFSHGVTATGPAYEPFLRRIAEAGYVVIAPTYPLSSGDGGTIFDYVNQPADVFFALDAVLERAEDPADALNGRLDGDLVAVAGHSLGAMTTVGAGFNSCCTDPRVDAAVVLAGIEAPFPDGDFTDRPPVPLLLGHGALDRTIAIDGSVELFAAATGPAALLQFPGGGHSDILQGAAGDVLVAAVVAWLDRWLLDDPTGLAALPATVEASGVGALTLRGVDP